MGSKRIKKRNNSRTQFIYIIPLNISKCNIKNQSQQKAPLRCKNSDNDIYKPETVCYNIIRSPETARLYFVSAALVKTETGCNNDLQFGTKADELRSEERSYVK